MDRQKNRSKLLLAGAIVAGVCVVGGGIAIASAGDDDEPLTGSTLDRATQAALEHVGGGTVIETEAGDDGAAYGVEIRLADGSVVEVALDEAFHVVSSTADDDGTGDETEDGDADTGADD